MSKSDAAGSSLYVYAVGSNRLQSVAGSNYALDAAGNTTRSDIKRMTYSANNRMTRFKDASTGAVSDYYHNGLGERAAKRVTGKLTLYLYDLSGDLIAEYDKSTRATTEYIYGASGRLATLSNQIYWHHNDHLGTPQALTDVNGTVVWTMSQTPFGIATVNEDPDQDGITVTNNFRFLGQYYDAESDLFYNYQRSFDPKSGRYTQSDPIGLSGGINTFAYVEGNPINKVDPTGENPVVIGLAVFCSRFPNLCLAGATSASIAICQSMGMCQVTASDNPYDQPTDNTDSGTCSPSKSDKPKCYFEREVYYGGAEKTCIYKQRGSFGLINVRQYANKPCPPINPDTCWVDKTGTPEEGRFPANSPYE